MNRKSITKNDRGFLWKNGVFAVFVLNGFKINTAVDFLMKSFCYIQVELIHTQISMFIPVFG